ASPLQIIWKVLLPEALPTIIDNVTVLIVNLIGYSAMAGAIAGKSTLLSMLPAYQIPTTGTLRYKCDMCVLELLPSYTPHLSLQSTQHLQFYCPEA
ncbi:hypothetical protein NE583_10980, partial [Veillonella parvula]|nr:hypothetical protein [Veillonella parvula]